ncbi:unnamed protein product [Allacma fusca]|uniref:Uncharacterized protein n=1 Tax=Allacma fusca TaxID=39272 RepID=A0A8J2PYA7_9HEXA|nr:unnamed protein product [Allacma fusca]
MPKLKSGYGLLLWYWNILLAFTYGYFVLFRCIQAHSDVKSSFAKRTYLKFAVVYYSFSPLIQFVILTNLRTFLQLSQQSIRFMQWIDENMAFQSPLLENCVIFMAAIFYTFNSISVIICNLVRFFLPKFTGNDVFGYMEFMFHGLAFLLFFNYLVLVYSSWAVLDEMRTWIQPSFLYKFGKFQRIYSMIWIHLKLCLETFSSLMAPCFQIGALSIAVFCTYSCIRATNIIGWGLGVLGSVVIILLIVVTELSSQIHVVSSGIREDLKRAGLLEKNSRGKHFLVCQS